MAASSLLALIDDIASLLDDVATLSGVAAKKTAGVLGDDLALNAQQVSGVSPQRELPVAAVVVWLLIVKANYKVVERIFLVASLIFLTYIVPAATVLTAQLSGSFRWLLEPLLRVMK